MKSEENKKLKEHIDQLENQVEKGALFLHTSLSNQAEKINQLETFILGLSDALIKKKSVTEEEIAQASEAIQQEKDTHSLNLHSNLAIRVDEPDSAGVQVNCEERMHICNAVCCKLTFALSVEEIESTKIKWDIGRPYFIRQTTKGCCTHLDEGAKSCQIYDNRPAVCKKYSCANDARIWTNFEKMELNTPWIDQNLGPDSPNLLSVRMDVK